jgi:hypothetical protein
MSLRVAFEVAEETTDAQFGIAIHDQEGRLIFGSNTSLLGHPVTLAPGPGELVFEFERVPLLDGTYMVTLGAQSRDEGTVYDWHEQRYSFSVMNPSRTPGLVALPLTVHFGEHELPPLEQNS